MPKLWVKDNGAWKQVQKLWTKNSGSWTTATTASIFEGGIGKQFYPDATPSVIYSTAGTYNYKVPAGVTSIQVNNPSITGMSSQNITVTPGQNLTILCGDYGVNSTITGTDVSSTIPAYQKVVFNHTSGNVDAQLTQTFAVATTNVITTTVSGGQTTTSNAAIAAGIYFVTNSESAQGDFSETVTLSTVPISSLVGTFRIIGAIYGNSREGNISYITQPTVANSYRCTFQIGEGGYSNHPVYWTFTIQQQGWIQIIPLNANVITYNSPGTYTFTVPAGVTSLNTTVIGGGGGSAGNYQSSTSISSGASGGHGVKLTGSLTVTPGQTYTIVVGSGGTFGTGSLYGGAAGAAGTGATNGSNGTANSQGGGGGGGGSSRISLASTTLIESKGGDGGSQSVGGAGGAGGGTNTIPSGFTTSVGTNGGAGGNLTLIYSGSYSNGTGSGQIGAIQSTLVSTYPYLYSSIGGVVGGGNDWNFPLTLAAGVNLVAQGAQQGFRTYPSYSTAYTTLNSGAFAVGRTVSGINFATGNTQGNGGQNFWFYNGDTWNSGGSGQVIISYGYTG